MKPHDPVAVSAISSRSRSPANSRMFQRTYFATTLLDVLRWLVLWGGVVHMKTGLWRICGYRVDAYFDKPWLSTNLVVFWGRFTFHYRAFLSRAFYYPVFFKVARKHLRVRVVVATLAATALGNLLWGHVAERLFYRGLEGRQVLEVLRTWPYFLLLGGHLGDRAVATRAPAVSQGVDTRPVARAGRGVRVCHASVPG